MHAARFTMDDNDPADFAARVRYYRRRQAMFAATIAVFVLSVVLTFAGAAHGQTAGPIETVPGYPGCGGNSTIRTITEDFTCANQRTYTLPNGSTRIVRAVVVFRPDGTGTAVYTLSAAVTFPVPLRIVSHVGISNGPVTSDVSGTIPAGSKGPATLNFTFACGQVDGKAVFVGNGDENGRIFGPYVCVVPVVPTTIATTTTTAAPTTTVPDTTTTTAAPTTTDAASSTTAPGTSPTTTPTGPGVSVTTAAPSTGNTPQPGGSAAGPASTIPRTGQSVGDVIGWALVVFSVGGFLVLIVAGDRLAARRRETRP